MEKFLIFLGYLVYQLESKTTECEELKIQSEVNCYQYLPNCYILEGDEENYSNHYHLDREIIKKSFLIPYKQEPILTRIIDSLNKNKIQEKLICSLFLNHEYFITCINFDLVLYEEETKYSEEIRFETKISSQDLCYEMYESQDGTLRLFCSSQFTFKEYQVNLQRNVTLIQEYDAADQIQDFCKVKQKELAQDTLIVAFYQCSKWKVLIIKNQENKVLLEAQMKIKDILIENYQFVEEVTFCERNQFQYTFFIIENSHYLQVFFDVQENLSTTNIFQSQSSKRLQKMLVLKKCQQLILVTQLEDNRTILSSKFLEISLDQQFQNNNIHFQSDLFFFQDQFKLIILIDSQLNQTYRISNTSINFFEFDNFFYQYDEIMQGLQFYKLYPLSSFIKPKKNYLYLISRNDLFIEKALIKCYKIVQEKPSKNEEQKFVLKVILTNTCTNILQKMSVQKNKHIIKDHSLVLNSNAGSINVSIQNNQEIQESFCLQRLQQFYFQGNIEFMLLKKAGYISVQNETHLFIYDCNQNKIIIYIVKDQFEVLESNGNFYIVNKIHNHQLRVIQCNQYFLEQITLKFDDVITEAKKIAESIFLYLNNSNLPLIILNNIKFQTYNYLQKSLYQIEPILFYLEIGDFKIIQYPNLLAIENEGNIQCFKFLEGVIIFIKNQMFLNDGLLLLTVEYFSRSLILSQYNDFRIHHISNYSFQDYQFSIPLRYQVRNQQLAILIEQNNSLFISIFQFNLSSIYFWNIISTDTSFFKFRNSNLLYSSNKRLRELFIDEFLVEVKTNTHIQNSLSSIYQNYQNPIQEDRGIELTIIIENSCYQLYPLKNLSIIEIEKYQIINLYVSDLFYGPTSSLNLLTNSSIKLNGPFQLRKKVQNCIHNISNFCIQKYHFQIQQTISSFQVVILENQNFGINPPQLEALAMQIYWIKQNYYLNFFRILDNLYIQLIQCPEQEYEYCWITSKLTDQIIIQQVQSLDLMRTGNLIKLFNSTLISIQDLSFTLVKIVHNYIDVIYIKHSQDLYLFFLKNKTNLNDLEIMIYSIHLNQISLIYQQLVINQFEMELNRTGVSYTSESTIKLVSSEQIGNEILIKFFILDKTKRESYIFFLKLEINQNLVQFQLTNYIRNIIPTQPLDSNVIIDFWDENFLVLKFDSANYINIYDLRQQREFYDYFYQTNNSIIIKRINTTHYIFQTHNGIYLGSIDYEIQIEDWNQINFDFDIFAQNEISNTKVSFQVHIKKKNGVDQGKIMLIQLICLIFIIFYLKNKSPKTNK